MKLKYETGIATLVQFIVLELLGIPIVLVELISACSSHSSQCSTNVFLSPVLFLLKAALYAGIAVIGYMAQSQRSRRLAQLLIICEFCLIPFSLFNLRHDTDLLTKIASGLGPLFAIWIILLAFRLARSKGGRIVKHSSTRSRNRKPHLPPK
jgi:hypothetical protein